MNTKTITFLMLLVCLTASYAQTTYYVTTSGTGSGTSWADASNDMQAMLNTAVSGDKIFVALGTYYPTQDPFGSTTPTDNRYKTFYLKDGVAIYGGFAGTETNESERTDIHTTNQTILSGDFNDDDVVSGSGATLSITNNTENVYNVVLSVNDTNTTILDGFTIKGGRATTFSTSTIEGVTVQHSRGGGINLVTSSLTINNLIITGNYASSGGGISGFSGDAFPTINNTLFSKNRSNGAGGGVNLHNTYITMNNVIFNGNKAQRGGGLAIFGTLVGASFDNRVHNATFYNNVAVSSTYGGGGIYLYSSDVIVENSIFFNNFNGGSANVAGADIEGESATTDIATVTYSMLQENSLFTGTGVISNQDPLFTDASNGDFSLQIGSPAINSGDNTNVTATTDIDGNSRIFNTTVDMGAYENQNTFVTWTGATNNDWATATNWSNGTVPTTADDVVVPTGLTNYPTISSAVTVNSIALNSGSSLIANASVTGNVTFRRMLTENWHLVASPVVGETFENLVSNNTFAEGTNSNIGIAPYDNNGVAWSYQSATATGALTSGEGLAVKLALAETISFNGSLNVPATINTVTTLGTANGYNLIGNPFTAFINSGTLLNSTNTTNLTEATIWLWNGTEYETKVASDNFKIAPGQGFFVEVSANGQVEFDVANQLHEVPDTFMRSEQNQPKVHLFVSTDKKVFKTRLSYTNNATKDFDNGYDGTLFKGVTQNFAIFTKLLSGNIAKKLAVQSLPVSDMENTIVPVGIISEANKEITFSAKGIHLPSGISVYLEDRKNGTFTNLFEENYNVTLTENSNESERFYLHTTSKRLSIESIKPSLENVLVYKSGNREITIAGLSSSNATITLFSILGKQVMRTKLNTNGTAKVNLPRIAKGIYIVKVTSNIGNVSRKITL